MPKNLIYRLVSIVDTLGVGNYKTPVRVWRKSYENVYKPEIYLPHSQEIKYVSFADNYKKIAIIRESGSTESDKKRFYEEWTSEGYNGYTQINSALFSGNEQINSVLFNEHNNLLKLISRNEVKIISIFGEEENSPLQNSVTEPQEKLLKVLARGKYVLIKDSNQFFIKNVENKKRTRLSFDLKEDKLPANILISDNGQVLCFSDGDSVKIINVISGKDITPVSVKSKDFNELRISANGRYLAFSVSVKSKSDSSNNTEVLSVTEIKNGRQFPPIPSKTNGFNDFVFSKDEKFLAAADYSGETQILCLKKQCDAVPKLQHRAPVHHIIFSPSGKTIATVSQLLSDGFTGNGSTKISIFDVKTGKSIAGIQSELFINSISFSPDGNYLATSNEQAGIMIWSLKINDLVSIAKARLVSLPE